MDVNDVDSFDPIAIYQQLILQNGLYKDKQIALNITYLIAGNETTK